MRRLIVVACCLLLAASFFIAAPAWAVGPVLSPAGCTLYWTAPTKNADAAGTPLTDLAAYRLYIGTAPGVYPATPTATIASPVPAPAANTTVQWSCEGLSDGQKYANVRPVDLVGNEAALSNEFPFVYDSAKPAGVTDLRAAP